MLSNLLQESAGHGIHVIAEDVYGNVRFMLSRVLPCRWVYGLRTFRGIVHLHGQVGLNHWLLIFL